MKSTPPRQDRGTLHLTPLRKSRSRGTRKALTQSYDGEGSINPRLFAGVSNSVIVLAERLPPGRTGYTGMAPFCDATLGLR